jgi:8-amino-3,8-dideoxy-alpha-D-manno-octulosonate transaminase
MPGYELIGKEERDAVNDVFDKGGVLYRYGYADRRQNIFRVDNFEKAFAEKFGVKYAVAVSSGTGALKTALEALEVKPGDEVITQSHTFIATVEAIIEVGAKPVITEIDKTLNMDPEDLKKKITSKTKVIIPVHMSGVSARMKEILAIAREKGIAVLEDNAQSCGGVYGEGKLGAIGNVGIFSFDFGKAMTTGEGGMIITNDRSIFQKSREYSDHGHELNPKFPRGEDTRTRGGFNYKMMELQGAIGLVQLGKLDDIIARQRKNKTRIKEGIRDIPGITFREVPNPEGDVSDTLTFFLPDREKAQKFVKLWTAKGFVTKNLPDAINWHYAGTWDHLFSKYDEYKGKDLSAVWRQSTDLLRRAIALFVFVKMEDSEINKIIDSIHEVAAKI